MSTCPTLVESTDPYVFGTAVVQVLTVFGAEGSVSVFARSTLEPRRSSPHGSDCVVSSGTRSIILLIAESC